MACPGWRLCRPSWKPLVTPLVRGIRWDITTMVKPLFAGKQGAIGPGAEVSPERRRASLLPGIGSRRNPTRQNQGVAMTLPLEYSYPKSSSLICPCHGIVHCMETTVLKLSYQYMVGQIYDSDLPEVHGYSLKARGRREEWDAKCLLGPSKMKEEIKWPCV